MDTNCLVDKDYFFSRINEKYRCCFYDLIEYIVSTLNRYGQEGLTQSEFLFFLDAGRSCTSNPIHLSVCYILTENIKERHTRALLNEVPERCYCNAIAYLRIQLKNFVDDRARSDIDKDSFLYETLRMCALQANLYKF